ncbi:sialate O-acetylesterase [Klebsiella pneumoniae]|uniref:sialate O-acetylesterase n=1 Tax=Klebsiella pneumoniae TaxID=573 RepID=UPI002E176FB5|nr:sialate O-acetylesterase [Klebsiella pneumoniae]
MKDLNDNALAYDDFMLSEEGTFVDRLGNEVPTLKGLSEIMRQAGESVVENTRQNLIPLSRQYMTLEAAQADIANIPKGSTTYYRSPDDSALAIEIINNGGTLEHTGREMPSQYALREPIKEAAHASQSPASAGVSANDIDDEYEYAIADRQGRIIERINADFIHRFIFPIISQQAKLGSAKGLSGIFYQDDIALGLDASGNVTAGSTETGTSNDMLYGVVDSSGRCLFRYDARGKFRAVLHEDVIRQISQEFGVSEFKKRMLADRVHIQMCGQSLAGGIGSNRISAAATATGWLMPSGGIEDGQTLSVGLTGLPLTSSSFVGMDPTVAKNLYENPLYGVCAQLQGMLNAESAAVSVSGSASWHGEYKISQLDKEGGSPQYDVAVAQSRAYAGYSSTEAKSFLSHVMCWIQGESDITAGTSPDEYLRRLNNLIADYQSDVGQDMPPVMVTYQTGSHTRRAPYYSPDIPQVQLLAANTNPYIFMACPTYVFPYNSDGVHMPGNSYRWMGCYFGKAIYHILTENAWKPLQPESVYRNGRVVTVVMHVPVSPLVLDTDMVSNPGDYGFEVWGDTDGARKTIQSVTVSGNRVKLVLDADPGQTVVVKYAQGTQGANAGPTTGARGNLRDSDSTLAYCRDVTATDPNSPYKLYNWCPIFSLKEGFSWVQ